MYSSPDPCDYDTEQEYLDAVDAYDAYLLQKEDMYMEEYYERLYN